MQLPQTLLMMRMSATTTNLADGSYVWEGDSVKGAAGSGDDGFVVVVDDAAGDGLTSTGMLRRTRKKDVFQPFCLYYCYDCCYYCC